LGEIKARWDVVGEEMRSFTCFEVHKAI